jgi:hypothetical protein
VLIFINVETRRVYISPSTYKPDEPWMIQQATEFFESTKRGGPKCKILMIDNDNKYSKPFVDAFKIERSKPNDLRSDLRTWSHSPNDSRKRSSKNVSIISSSLAANTWMSSAKMSKSTFTKNDRIRDWGMSL